VRILVIEDDRPTRRGLEQILLDAEAEVKGVGTLAEARTAAPEFAPDVCIVDLSLPDGDGMDFLRESRAEDARREIIVLTGNASIDTAVEAMKAGAFDYLLKPLKPAQIGVVLDRLSEKRDLEREVDDLRRQLAETGKFGAMIGKSEPMQQLFRVISRVAKSDAPVMILGESGTGKEVAATTIHDLSRRRAKPFIAINCGAVSPNLIESELFGHERGAFTGADKRRSGMFEMAHGGTLFLDEVTEMSAELQVKLLRVLETRTFRRVGGNEELKVDVRVLSSSNRNIEEAIREGKLREDFYYRLNVFPLTLPPLREHKEDVPHLARYFLDQIESREKTGVRQIDDAALAILTAHAWPGNVRELRNVVHRAYVLSNPPTIDAEALRSVLDSGRKLTAPSAPATSGPGPVPVEVGDTLEDLEKRLIRKTLDSAKGSVEKAARMMKLTPAALKTKLKKYRIAAAAQ
jgi:two-component system, NtrC family, response regulator AtoC